MAGKYWRGRRSFGQKRLRKQIMGLLAQLPASTDYFMPRIMAYLETLPDKLVAGEKAVEPLVADLIADGVRSIDLEKVIREQLAKMDPSALERVNLQYLRRTGFYPDFRWSFRLPGGTSHSVSFLASGIFVGWICSVVGLPPHGRKKRNQRLSWFKQSVLCFPHGAGALLTSAPGYGEYFRC